MVKKSKAIPGLENLEPEIASALIKAGYKTVESISIASPEELMSEVYVGTEFAEQLIQLALKKVSIAPMTAEELLKDEQNRGKAKIGVNSLDSLLDGGVWEKEITEFAGGFATGKTQICFQLSVTAQLPRDEGGLDGKVYYIDTEGTFSAQRVGEIAYAMELDPRETLRNIIVTRAMNSTQQLQQIKNIPNLVDSDGIKLVIVDSIASHFRTDYVGDDQIVERQQRIMQHGAALTNLAYVHGLAVVVTNQVVASIGDLSSSKDTRPALGQAWSHRPQTRVLLRRSPGQARIARLLDSPRMPEREEVFYITGEGVRDRSGR